MACPDGTERLLRLKEFLSVSENTSTLVASPLVLWNVLRDVVECCVAWLTDAHLVAVPKSFNGKTEALEVVVAESLERMGVIEVLLGRLFDDVNSLKEMSTDCFELKQNNAHVQKEINDLSTRFEKLMDGVVKHAEDVAKDISRIEESSSQRLKTLKEEVDQLSRKASSQTSQPIGLGLKEWQGEALEVVDVLPNSRSSTAGVRCGDFIIGVNGLPCRSKGDLLSLLATAPSVTLRLLRNQRSLDVHVL